LALTLCVLHPALAALEETFDVLQIGTRTYTNVTVTTKAKTYVFLLYNGGMGNFKVSELPRKAQQKLGYLAPDPVGGAAGTESSFPLEGVESSGPAPKFDRHNPMPWLKFEIAALKSARPKALNETLAQAKGKLPREVTNLSQRDSLIAAGGVFFVYLFFSYCCSLICHKAGGKPGLLVWLPILKVFPLLRAAGMSGWWFLGFMLPAINIVGFIIWCLEISKARGKSAGVGLLLILPVLNILAFLYLAFSQAKTKKVAVRAPRAPVQESYVLETA